MLVAQSNVGAVPTPALAATSSGPPAGSPVHCIGDLPICALLSLSGVPDAPVTAHRFFSPVAATLRCNARHALE
eukprot:CAMPEP_0204582840 /NCGR_PEP_ID=MMETSP0661-20131031/45445_1 /ASSEMBLY_ACC=CAM_ASM_000606 /TAXON_ID=109239 /ORGANISM="Alexandrium margalefi, Strain AMGDE01CS-322" /LENGTH=73 /DNA_ID=CAMNT_0051592151 /DNA_START=137 /DNA_END=354 /DNA_ORIENTATION=-